MKTCSKCKQVKPAGDYYHNGLGRLRSACKGCTKTSRRASETYQSAQVAYNRSDKGKARHHRYNVSQAGRNRNEAFYYDNRDTRLDVGRRQHQLRRIRQLGGEFKVTSQPHYGSFFTILSPDELRKAGIK